VLYERLMGEFGMRWIQIAVVCLIVGIVVAQDSDESNLIGWNDGTVVVWSFLNAESEPLYPSTVPKILNPRMLSPDGKYVVYGITDSDISDAFPTEYQDTGYVLHELAIGTERIITEPDSGSYSYVVTWSPNASQIAWVRLDENSSFLLEVYDISSDEVTLVNDSFYGGFIDGGAGVSIPYPPEQWIDKMLISKTSGYSQVTGSIEEIILIYRVDTGEVDIFAFEDYFLLGMPTLFAVASDVDGNRVETYRSAFIWYDDATITGNEADNVYYLVSPPHLRTMSAPDDALTFIPYINMGSWIHWFARRSNGEIFETNLVTRQETEVFPSPDGNSLLLKPVIDYQELPYYVMWSEGVDLETAPQFDGMPLGQTHEWIMPDCERPLSFSISALKYELLADTLAVRAMPHSTAEVILEITPEDPIRRSPGLVCIDGTIWRQIWVESVSPLVLGWIPEIIDGNYTIQQVGES